MSVPLPTGDGAYLLHPRLEGGWWVTRTPDDAAADTHGLTDGHVICLLSGLWKATSWDRETVVHGPTLDAAARALVALRWSPATGPASGPDGPADGPTGLDPAQQDVDQEALDRQACSDLWGIVAALASCDPVAQDAEDGWSSRCVLCGVVAPGMAETLAESQHHTDCPWTAARTVRPL